MIFAILDYGIVACRGGGERLETIVTQKAMPTSSFVISILQTHSDF